MPIKTRLKYWLKWLPVQLRCRLFSLLFSGRVQKGSGSFIHPSVHMLGKKNIKIGNNACISEGCWINVNHRIEGKFSVEIGNHCFIGKRNFFSSGDSITIADYSLTTYDCKFIGSTHIIEHPQIPYIMSGTTADDKIRIGVNCFIGAGATVLGNVTIGHGSVIGTNALVLSHVPPFSVAVGNPATVVKRYSFLQEKWLSVSEFTAKDEAHMLDEQAYLHLLSTRFNQIDIPWIAAGKSMGDL